MFLVTCGCALGILASAMGCERVTISDPPFQNVNPTTDVQLRQTFSMYGVVSIGAVPAGSPALVDLGRALFFDKLLSGNRDVSCATCHDAAAHFGDGLSLSIGTGGDGIAPARTLGSGRQFVPRNAPTLINAGLTPFFLFWDGRVSAIGGPGNWRTPVGSSLPAGINSLLAAQAMLPVTNRDEMRGKAGDLDRLGNPNELAAFGDSAFADIWKATMVRILSVPEYVAKFSAAFPGTPTSSLGFQHAANAIAAFELSAFTKVDSPLDRYLARNDGALTPAAKRGALLFFGKAQCASCHSGPFLGGQSFSNAGVPQLGPGVGTAAPLDIGRAAIEPQMSTQYKFAFRVAPLRNVELSAPYMHNGAFPTLEAVLGHYNNAPETLRNYDVTQLDPSLRPLYRGDATTISAILSNLDFRLQRPLGLTQPELSDLLEFLKSFTDPSARDMSALTPASVPSGLPVR
jgi:cytochrome c peroxidase